MSSDRTVCGLQYIYIYIYIYNLQGNILMVIWARAHYFAKLNGFNNGFLTLIIVFVINHSLSLHQRISCTSVSCLLTNHHPHIVPQARISVTLSHHFSLSFIASGRSSELNPISSHSCCKYVQADRPAIARL